MPAGYWRTQALALIVTVCVTTEGCLAWKPVDTAQPGEISPGRIAAPLARVRTVGGEEIVLQDPFFRADSVGGTSTYPTTATRIFAIRELKSVEIGAPDTRKMTLIAAGLAVTFVAAIGIIHFLFSLDPTHTLTAN